MAQSCSTSCSITRTPVPSEMAPHIGGISLTLVLGVGEVRDKWIPAVHWSVSLDNLDGIGEL